MQPSPEANAVREHLGRVLASAGFHKAPRLARFLSFVVEATLAGDGGQIKESLIAIEVYGRKPDYDPQTDTIVRVDARRLRDRLAQYYDSTGNSERLRIEIPKGTYAPVFRRQQLPSPPEPHRRSSYTGIAAVLCLICTVPLIWTLCGGASRVPARTGRESISNRSIDLYHRAYDLLRIPVTKNAPLDRMPRTVPESVRLFRELTTREPRFAEGWAGLAEAAEWQYELGGNQPADLLVEARGAAEKAIELDPQSQDGWNVLASILFYREWDFSGAERACRRAIELDPRNTVARRRFIDILRMQGRVAEARLEIERAAGLQPTSAALRIRRAVLLADQGRYDDALTEARTAADLTNRIPVYPMTLWLQGLCFEQKRRVDDAERLYRLALVHQPSDTWNRAALGHLLARTNRRAEAKVVLSDLASQVARRRLTYAPQALIHAGLGNREAALESLESAWRCREDSLLFLLFDPRLLPLHSEARFQQLVRRVRG